MELLYRPRRKSISLTALIDVVFILLMFFMLTSTFTRYKAVDFQAPVAAATETPAEQPQRVILRPDGSFRLESGAVIATDVTLSVDFFEVGRPIVLLPEGDSSVQAMVTGLEQLKGLGLAVTLGRAIPVAAGQD